jgi:hypothetical protein
MKRLSIACAMLALAVSVAQAQFALAAAASAPKFKVLTLAESGGHHVEFTKAAKPWLKRCGEESGFEVDYITKTASITEAFLARYQLVLQLEFVPYGWTPEAMAAFKAYIEEGRGGWVGLHHATLLGNFDGYPMWPWFSDFMGKIKFTAVPEDLKKWAGTFCLYLPHGRDESTQNCPSPLPVQHPATDLQFYSPALGL